jgi:hypothetical protein
LKSRVSCAESLLGISGGGADLIESGKVVEKEGEGIEAKPPYWQYIRDDPENSRGLFMRTIFKTFNVQFFQIRVFKMPWPGAKNFSFSTDHIMMQSRKCHYRQIPKSEQNAWSG